MFVVPFLHKRLEHRFFSKKRKNVLDGLPTRTIDTRSFRPFGKLGEHTGACLLVRLRIGVLRWKETL